MKYEIQAQLKIELEADSVAQAKESAEAAFKVIEKASPKAAISDAKVVDKATGYFVT